MNLLRLMLAGLVVFLCVGVGPAGPPKKPGGEQPVVSRLAQLENAEREQLLKDLSASRSALQTELIKQLASPQSKHHQIAAAYLLGLYRMDGAAGALAKVITIEAELTKEQKREGLWDRYPAVEALVRIGMPAIPAVIERVETSDDGLGCELAAKVVHTLLKRKLAELALAEAIERQEDEAKRKRLYEMLAHIKALG